MKLTQHDSFLFEGLVLGLVAAGLSLSGDTSLHLRLRWSSPPLTLSWNEQNENEKVKVKMEMEKI